MDDLVTFVQWVSGRPFGADLPTFPESLRLEQAFTAGLRHGRESEPPLVANPAPVAPGSILEAIVLDKADTVALTFTTVDAEWTRARRISLDRPSRGITRWTVAIDSHGCKRVTVDRS
jgi:hypothetical protein